MAKPYFEEQTPQKREGLILEDSLLENQMPSLP